MRPEWKLIPVSLRRPVFFFISALVAIALRLDIFEYGVCPGIYAGW